MEPGVFLDLITQDQIPAVVLGFEKAITDSFVEDRRRESSLIIGRVQRITHEDMKDRGKKCLEIFRILRGDLKWSVPRILDELPRLLREKLDTGDITVGGERRCWTPG